MTSNGSWKGIYWYNILFFSALLQQLSSITSRNLEYVNNGSYCHLNIKYVFFFHLQFLNFTKTWNVVYYFKNKILFTILAENVNFTF